MIDYNIDYLRCLHNQAGQGREREEKASVKAFVESCKGGGRLFWFGLGFFVLSVGACGLQGSAVELYRKFAAALVTR